MLGADAGAELFGGQHAAEVQAELSEPVLADLAHQPPVERHEVAVVSLDIQPEHAGLACLSRGLPQCIADGVGLAGTMLSIQEDRLPAVTGSRRSLAEVAPH